MLYINVHQTFFAFMKRDVIENEPTHAIPGSAYMILQHLAKEGANFI